MCTPRLLRAPEHLMQMKTPKVIDLQISKPFEELVTSIIQVVHCGSKKEDISSMKRSVTRSIIKLSHWPIYE